MRLKIRTQEAEKAAKNAREAPKRAEEAKTREAKEARERDRVAKKLPKGVGLVTFSGGKDNWVARVHIGDGVQFDLVCRKDTSMDKGFYHESKTLSVYEAGSDYNLTSLLAIVNFTSHGAWQYEVEDLLVKAVGKHDAKRKVG
jgi:hypothetical protein